jgi:anti-anti-sigma factor
MQFLIETVKKNDFTFIKHNGELNYEGAMRLKLTFNDAINLGEKKFILDLKNCKTISSFALSVILKLNDSIKEKNGVFMLVCPSGDVADIFDVIDIRNLIPIFSSENELWQKTSQDNLKNPG